MPGYDEWLEDESSYGSLTQLPNDELKDICDSEPCDDIQRGVIK